MIKDNRKIKDILTRGVERIVVGKELEKKLRSGKKLRIKHGIDPTTKELHIGYSIIYEKLRLFQELGHQVVFLIGGFTGRFGDPAEKIKARKLRDKKEVEAMAKKYLNQAGKILDLKKLEIRSNSEWYDKMKAEDLLRIMSHFSIQNMLERNMFQERFKKGLEVQLHEPIYPLLQAYDSVMLKSDVEIGGNDQLFNILKGRELQKHFHQSPQSVLTVRLLIGLDGKQKMSQSLGNCISFNDSPKEKYGKTMSIPDSLIKDYFELATRVPILEIEKIKGHPKELKARLAREIISIYHDKKEALKAEQEFNKVFSEKKLPSSISRAKIKSKQVNILDLLVKTKLAPSKAEAKRLILQKGVKINGQTQEDWKRVIKINNQVVQVGKRKFIKLI